MGDLFRIVFGDVSNVSLLSTVIAINMVVGVLGMGYLRGRLERSTRKDQGTAHAEELELNEVKRRTLLQKAMNRVLELRKEDLVETYIPGWQMVSDFVAGQANFLSHKIGQWLGPKTPFSQESLRQYYGTKKGDRTGLQEEARRRSVDWPGYNTRRTTRQL